ncbi:anaphase-promoting complex protein [Paracoccidioides lutzii Pb01]|uniref:Anaphase-promoting complex subunit 5 n=1 Tax=Paracoccidioides lutzii (strain ATCC MYA-826 / Pb01) TaxID=502779 RepID=C1H540_PARBA|nr:anaphase-promoting complex protein [Paracoccidioides lutzii Pb01]EEH34834.1 anaphase-promoting complex protein [Paracoccidioides lutzii Pb01]
MGRYLTPSKIALLALVSVYTEGAVPNSAIVPVLSFLISHLLPLRPSALTTSQDKRHAIPIQDFEAATLHLASSIPGRTVWDLLLKKLWHLNCSDELDDFFICISEMLMKTREEQIYNRDNGIAPETGRMLLSRSSPLGAFVRRAQLEYSRLQFHDAMALWRGFIKYRLPTYQLWVKRNPLDSQMAVDINLVELGLDLTSPLAKVVYGELEEGKDVEVGMSTRDIERLLDFQVGEMQSIGCRITEEMKSRLEQMIASGVSIPSSQHYIKFLDSWRAGDYSSSFDHLHHYFDYTMQNRDRTFYQYALLNLAILQADFGCHGEAVSAMQEAISIARETHDMSCLNFCMSWVYHFGKAFPDEMRDVQNTRMLGSEKETLAFLQAKSKEIEMWSLMSTSMLSEAKLELQHGESVASAFEHIVKASFLIVNKRARQPIGSQLMLQASVYVRIGVAHVAWSNCEIFRECYAKQAPFDDNFRATCRSSLLLAAKGSYFKSMARLNEVPSDALNVLKYQQNWTFFCGLLKLQRQLHRDDKLAVEELIPQLHACAPPDLELAMTLSFLEVDFQMRKGNYAAALKIIEEIAQSIRQENFDVANQVKLLVAKARIFDQTHQPERGFSLAMRAAHIAYQSRYLPGLWESIGVLSVILMTFKEFEAALEILDSIVPQVLECEDSYLAARTYALLADASMGLAGQAQRDKVRQKEHMARAVEFIDCAFGEFSNMEDVQGQCEMMAKKATVMHLSGDRVLANDYAAKYLDLRRQAVEG